MEQEDIRYVQKVKGQVMKAIREFDLIQDGDKIMVGVSGGKDSVSLLNLLGEMQHYGVWDFKVVACHINVTTVPYEIDNDFIREICENLQVEYHHIDMDVDLERDPKKTKCFVCSWHRRKKLFDITQELGCTKLALGHHADDAIETLLMNMVNHASISSMPPKLDFFKGKFDLIRPMIYLNNKQLRKYCELHKFPTEKEECPYQDQTQRDTMRKYIDEFEQMNKFARSNLFNAMRHIYHDYLPPALPIETQLHVKRKKEGSQKK